MGISHIYSICMMRIARRIEALVFASSIFSTALLKGARDGAYLVSLE